jgi:M6 family metalloprotease-like protein
MKRLLFIIFIISAFARLSAVPAYPFPVVYMQPNGVEITLIMKGDEFVRFAQTLDGFTLLRNDEGYFCYAQKNAQGDIEPSEFYAEEIPKRSAAAEALLAQTPKELRFSSSQMAIYQQIRDMVQYETEVGRVFAAGERKLLTILMQYPDKPMVKTQEEFNFLFNQINYVQNGFRGSVKDYFLEISYNTVEITTTVVGPFTAINNHAYYAERGAALAREGVQKAYAAGVNFSEFAVGNIVPGFYMIYAGHGAEAGATNSIWAHASQINPSITYNGVTISKYACSPELRDNFGRNITNIGVICHELGHNPFGNPDYYDTNYATGGQYDGTGRWDLQAGGSWNDGGRTPAAPNPRWKWQTFSTEFNLLETPQTVTVPASRIYKNAYFRINTQTPNEYFVIENITKGGYNFAVPGTDLVIYRCAANMAGMNTTSPQKFYPVAANAPVALPASGSNAQADYGTINSGFCPWPGALGKTEFSDTTKPAMVSWANVPSGKPITNITKHGDYITFDFMGGGEKNNFHVFLPSYYGCVITPQPLAISPVNKGGDYAFVVEKRHSHNNSVLRVTANNIELTPISNTYTILNIQEDQIVRIEGLVIDTVQVFASADENGKITPSGTIKVNYGGLQTFQIAPDIGYSVDKVLVDEVNVGSNKNYTLSNIIKFHSIHATFKLGDLYTINVSPDTLVFYSTGGSPSEELAVTISSPDVIGGIVVTAPQKFQIFHLQSGNWVQTINIQRNELPYSTYIRYVPSGDEYVTVEDLLALKSLDAYAAVHLFGHANIGIMDIGNSNLVVFPNPTTGELRITNNGLQILGVDVLDIYGRKVGAKFPSNELEGWQPQADGVVFNISHLPNGLYFIKVRTESGEVTKKIIKN